MQAQAILQNPFLSISRKTRWLFKMVAFFSHFDCRLTQASLSFFFFFSPNLLPGYHINMAGCLTWRDTVSQLFATYIEGKESSFASLTQFAVSLSTEHKSCIKFPNMRES